MKLDDDKSTYPIRIENIVDEGFFINLLAVTKNERLEILNSLNTNEKLDLARILYKKIPTMHNAEDKMISLWIAGELKEERLTNVIQREFSHKHGGVRRMVCSALGKIGSDHGLDTLHRGLQDPKPQVRQYAAKALKSIGNDKTLRRLYGLLNNPNEVEYVRRCYEESIKTIEERIKHFKK